jgi:molybdopterin converting factor small subunit
MASISLHYWAGARAAAGFDHEVIEADTVAAALRRATHEHNDRHFERVLRASSLLIDGLTAHQADLEQARDRPVRVEILPPFAGGA